MTAATKANLDEMLETSVKFGKRKPRLTKQQLAAMQQEFDDLQREIKADLGQKDVDYIKGIIRVQRYLEITGRTLIHFSFTPIPFMLGVTALSVSKILNNMEIGHSTMHGAYDFTNDPKLYSLDFEWDTACSSDSWRQVHNVDHHTHTNVVGKDRDFGYGMLRLSNDTPWHIARTPQIIYFTLLTIFFQWGVALHELESENIWKGTYDWKAKQPIRNRMLRKAAKQAFKDYVFFPALAGPFFWKTMLGNAMANIGRNLWASAIIFCGHFPEQAVTFTEEECKNETRGEWYYRQILSSVNLEGGKLLHIMSGHLSYHVEHHLFPDIPVNRYEEMSPRVKAICEKYGLPYNSGTFWQQYVSSIKRVIRYSFPGGEKATDYI